MSVLNFIKIRKGQDFFVDLVWNDPSTFAGIIGAQ